MAISGIDEIAKYGRGRQGLIPLWVGEGDTPTQGFINEAATRSLAAGETFYTDQRGIPEYRDAVARYVTKHYGTFDGAPHPAQRFFATIGGMHAFQLAVRMVAGAGDEVIVPTPAWPNVVAAAEVNGARAVCVPMHLAQSGRELAWSLDLAKLRDAINPRTRMIFINSPSNPLGVVHTREELAAILAMARAHGLWIVADEIYGRLVNDGGRAPSFHDVMEPGDLVMFVQTMSKNWAMTGWRLGWLEAPAQFDKILDNLIQYSTSGVPVFTQRAGIVALERGEDVLAHQIARMTQSRDILCEGLMATGRVSFARPQGAFYLFAKIDGEPDSRALALRLIDEAGIGLAPGAAFGPGGEGFIRICYARKVEDMREATRRLVAWLKAR